MKKIFLLLLLAIFSKAIYAQTPNWQWAETQTGGACYTQAQQISASPHGSIYMSGRYGGTMTLGGITPPNTSQYGKVFSGKMDSSGRFIWIATDHPASGGTDYNYGFARDNNDNTYCTGTEGSFYIDKYDSNGVQKWVVVGGGAAGYDIKTDNSGNVYVTGEFGGSFTIGTKTVNSAGSNDMFLAKLDSNGNCKWMVSGGGTGYDGGRSVALDAAGFIYVCGSYANDAAFGSVTAPTVVSGYPSLFIVKYDSSGNAIRVSTATNAGFDPSYSFWRWNALTVDSTGNAFVCGTFTSTAQFSSLSATNLGVHNIFVAKCHFDGKWEWLQTGLGSGDNTPLGITLDKAFDVYVTGAFETTTNFGGTSVTASSANGSPFVAKYNNSTGELQWIQTAGGTGNWGTQGISVDKNKYVYIDGNGGGGTGVFGSHNVVSQYNCYSDQNVIIAKLGTVPPRAIIPVLQHSYCPGSTDSVPYSLIGSFNSGNTFIVELSDSTGNFITYDTLGSFTSNANGKIGITIPSNTIPGTKYFIRIVSTNPATSSYAASTGDSIDSLYYNSFFITIGGASTLSISASADTICSGGSVTLIASGGSSYTWNTGATTDTIIVKPTTDTTYIVTASGGCSGSDSVKLTVNAVLPLTIFPQGASICSGQKITLTADTTGNSYTWSPANGLSATTGDSVVANPTADITYTITGIDSLGCQATGTESVLVGTGPNKPIITLSVTGDTLFANAKSGVQWYVNGLSVSGATDSIYVITGLAKGDTVTVEVTNIANGCSTISNPFIVTGINQLLINSNQLSIYPNPTNGIINVIISSSVREVRDWNLQLTDVLGQIVYNRPSLNYTNEIDVSNLPGGIYFITVVNKAGRAVFPIVKQN